MGRISIYTYVVHETKRDQFFSYAPYIREMNLWLKHVDEVEIVAPLKKDRVGSTNIPYEHQKLEFVSIPSINFLSVPNTFLSLLKLPIIGYKIRNSMAKSDHIHLRCPGNMCLIACILQIFFPKKQKTAKYAGNWDPKANQPLSYRLQKWILSNTLLTRNMKVLVYGDWPNQSKNILPFFTASFSEIEKEKIEKDLNPPFKFLFVGNLVLGKQPLFPIELVKALNAKNINAELHVYGDGELMDDLKKLAGNKSYIHLHGNQPLEVVKQVYKDSHFLILASKSEGWPKAVAEAMFFGCIPVVSGVSCVPWMLKAPPAPEGGAPKVTVIERGILIPPPDSYRIRKGGDRTKELVEETCNVIQTLIKDPEEMKRMSREAQGWSQEYTLERFEKEIKKVLKV